MFFNFILNVIDACIAELASALTRAALTTPKSAAPPVVKPPAQSSVDHLATSVEVSPGLGPGATVPAVVEVEQSPLSSHSKVQTGTATNFAGHNDFDPHLAFEQLVPESEDKLQTRAIAAKNHYIAMMEDMKNNNVKEEFPIFDRAHYTLDSFLLNAESDGPLASERTRTNRGLHFKQFRILQYMRLFALQQLLLKTHLDRTGEQVFSLLIKDFWASAYCSVVSVAQEAMTPDADTKSATQIRESWPWYPVGNLPALSHILAPPLYLIAAPFHCLSITDELLSHV